MRDLVSERTQSKTGQENDVETGLDYYNARYYDPQIQRFIQPDTELPNVYDPQQLNRYSYVRNNPETLTDPSGHCLEDLCIGEGILAAAAIGEVVTNPEVDEFMENVGEGVGETVGKFVESGGEALEKTGTAIENKLPVVEDASLKINREANDVDVSSNTTFKSFTSGNFRVNLSTFTGENPEDAQAHHVFPQQADLQAQFNDAGMNIHEPQYGAWWNSTPGLEGNHSSMAKAYNTDWRSFLEQAQNPTLDQILEQGRVMSNKYGFDVNY